MHSPKTHQEIVNLTLMMVTRGVDLILPTYLYDPYQFAFKDSELRNQLILHMLKQAPSNYILTHLASRDLLMRKVLQMALKEHLLIKSLIHQGIHQLLPPDTDLPIVFNPPAIAPHSRKSAR